jgi:hypothetical protein
MLGRSGTKEEQIVTKSLEKAMPTRTELSKIAEDTSGHTRLMRAAHEGNVRTIRMLAAGGSDVNATDERH